MKTIKTLIYVFLGIIILILGLIFSLANMTPVTLKFYHYETVPIPLWFLVIISILAGSLFTIILVLFDLYRGSRRFSRLKKECNALDKNLKSLKEQNNNLENEKKTLKMTIDEQTNSNKKNNEITSSGECIK